MTFTCNNCGEEKENKELASTVPVYQSDPIKTCRDCYNFYHNPPKEKKVERNLILGEPGIGKSYISGIIKKKLKLLSTLKKLK
jgi:DNA replication protein DnaC